MGERDGGTSGHVLREREGGTIERGLCVCVCVCLPSGVLTGSLENGNETNIGVS